MNAALSCKCITLRTFNPFNTELAESVYYRGKDILNLDNLEMFSDVTVILLGNLSPD